MRKAKENELEKVSKFMIEQFIEKDELQIMFKGIEPNKAKLLATKMLYFDLTYFFKYGDIFIYGDNMIGAIVGIDTAKLSLIKRVIFSLKGNKIAKELLSKDEILKISDNSKIIKEVHSHKWFKNHSKNKPYYIAQFAIDKNSRGKGIAREMLEELFNYVSKDKNNLVLETLSKSNVPIYEHFGFKIKESYETKNKQLTEFRMIKELNK